MLRSVKLMKKRLGARAERKVRELATLEHDLQEAIADLENVEAHHAEETSEAFQIYLRVTTWLQLVSTRLYVLQTRTED